MDETTNRRSVGSLLYLGICTRLDILNTVSKAAKKLKELNIKDSKNLLRIIKVFEKNHKI